MTDEDWRKHVPKGWWPIFDQLLVGLAALHPDFEISQAKEKSDSFGFISVAMPQAAINLRARPPEHLVPSAKLAEGPLC